MKNLLPVLMMLLAMNLIAQSTHTIDFEPAGIGADWNWVVDANGSNPPLEFVSNPSASGINASAKAAKFTALAAGYNWALTFTDDDGEFTFDASNTTVSIMVYKPVISVVSVKFEGLSGAIELQQTNTVINEWEQLTFDFSAQIGNTYSRIVFIPDFVMPYVTGQDRTQDNVVYFDNLVVPDGVLNIDPAPATPPTPQPTAAAEDVISVFSDVYTDLTTTWHPAWGQLTIYSDEIIAGTSPEDHVKKLKNFGYEGVTFTSTSLSLMEFVHFDVWSYDETSIKFYLLAGGPEPFVTKDLNTGQWNSFDVPLTDFIGGNLASVTGIKLESGTYTWPNGTSLVYMDNIYFWKHPTISGTDATLSDLQVDGSTIAGFDPGTIDYNYGLEEGTTVIPQITLATPNDPNVFSVDITQASAIPGDATVVVVAEDEITTKTYTVSFAITIPNSLPPTPTADADDVISIYSDAYDNVPGTNYNPWWGQQTIVTVNDIIAGNNTLKYANLNYQGTEFTSQDVSGYEFIHVDFWTANSTALSFFLISPGPVEVPYALTITPQSWVSVDIPLSAFAPVDLASVFQFKVAGDGDVWFDNWYFWKSPAAAAWTGSVDNNWHNAGNWTNGIPGAVTDVTIPAGLTNYPTVSAAASCNNITLGSDASTTATLVDNGNLTVNGTATVQRFYATGGTTLEEWHLIGSPVSDETAGMYSGFYLQWYQEGADAWNDVVSVNDPLTSLQGFAFYAPNDGMSFNYTGTLGDGTYNMPISASGPIAYHWNLFGNPYPSSLDWDLVAPANIANLQSGAVYYLDQATGNYLSYNGGAGTGSRYVAPGQGFFVSGASDLASFTVDNSMRTHSGGSAFYKAEFDNQLVITAEGNGFSDATYLRFDEEATTGIDKQFDAFKIIGVSNPELPQLFTISGDNNLSINVLPESEAVSAGFKAGAEGTFTISATEITGIENVILEDLVTGILTDLSGSDYTFSYTTADPDNRFMIHFMTVSVPEQLENMVNIYSTGKQVNIYLPMETQGEAVVYNTMGQQIATTGLSSRDNHITLQESGIYLVNVNIEGQVISKKIFIK